MTRGRPGEAHRRKQSLINSCLLVALLNVEGVRMKKTLKTDPNLVAFISDLKRESREKETAIWRDIALRLEKPSKNWAEVNLSKLERYASEGDVIVVAGKVLGAGSLKKKVTVAAFKFSESASAAIEKAGGKKMTITELVADNPAGTGVRIMG